MQQDRSRGTAPPHHTMMNHSQDMEVLCLRLDMLGVVIFILGDIILGIYMTFWCEPLPRKIYWAMGPPSAQFASYT